MGLLVDGLWSETWHDTAKHGGRFVRQDSSFRDWVAADPEARFPAEPGRYHLFVAMACPWAHRTLIVRKLKGLQEAIPVHTVEPLMLEHGWVFPDNDLQVPGGTLCLRYLHQLYTLARPGYTGRVTVPTLWDSKTGTIVNNESADIMRMLNSAFDALTDDPLDLYPARLRPEIDALNTDINARLNEGVYRCGFATSQEAYAHAFQALFDCLDALEARLARQRYLLDSSPTEADWRLFPTLLRFDPVYFGHFKCNLRRIADYPNLDGYLRELFQWPGIRQTVDLEETKLHYYGSHAGLNPSAIIPAGPAMALELPHGRGRPYPGD